MKTWFNFLSLSYPAGTQQVSWGKKEKRGKEEGVSEKQTESLPEQVLHFLKRPPNNRGEIHWVTCPPHTLQKKATVLQIQKKLFNGLHFSLTSQMPCNQYMLHCSKHVQLMYELPGTE